MANPRGPHSAPAVAGASPGSLAVPRVICSDHAALALAVLAHRVLHVCVAAGELCHGDHNATLVRAPRGPPACAVSRATAAAVVPLCPAAVAVIVFWLASADDGGAFHGPRTQQGREPQSTYERGERCSGGRDGLLVASGPRCKGESPRYAQVETTAAVNGSSRSGHGHVQQRLS